ncbi:MAG: HEAT repeat domain-containing protein [Chroococcales cyanobacterium]
MTLIQQNDKKTTRYRGANWQGISCPVSLKPHDALICCDLRNTQLEGLDLSGVEFFGCRLNGTSFRGATLRGTRFVGCFSSDEGPAIEFKDAMIEGISVIDSHLHFTDPTLTDSFGDDDFRVGEWDPRHPISKWPLEVATAATQTLSERNDTRSDAAIALKELDKPVVAPLLGTLLADPEWEVRSMALEVLANLRHQEFPQGDRALLEWMFLRLGDDHSIVRQKAVKLVEKISPPDEVLVDAISEIMASSLEEQREGLVSVIQFCQVDEKYCHLLKQLDPVLLPVIHRQMRADSSEENLAGLDAAIDLCELDDRYFHLWDEKTIRDLRSSTDVNVSEQACELWAILEEADSLPNLLPGHSSIKPA